MSTSRILVRRMAWFGVLTFWGLAGLLWGLGEAVRDREPRYQDHTSFDWAERITNGPPTDQIEALAVARQVIVPDLLNRIRSDTNDWAIRFVVADIVNQLPGIDIRCTDFAARRVQAIHELALFNTNSAPAIPLLLDFLQTNDGYYSVAAAQVLPDLGTDAATMVPLLIARLTNSAGQGVPVMVQALAGYGSRARSAVPALVRLLGDRSSKEIVWSVPRALKAIDPEAAAKAGVK